MRGYNMKIMKKYLLFLCINSYAYAMHVQSLWQQQIEIMCLSYAKNNILDKFYHILHLPIEPSKKYPICVTSAVNNISVNDYDLLSEKYKEEKDHIDSSLLWTFVQLPQDVQKNIVLFAMNNDEFGAEQFIRLPFLYALKNWVHIKHKVIPRPLYPTTIIEKPHVIDCSQKNNLECIGCWGCLGGCSGLIGCVVLGIKLSLDSVVCLPMILGTAGVFGGTIVGGGVGEGCWRCHKRCNPENYPAKRRR